MEREPVLETEAKTGIDAEAGDPETSQLADDGKQQARERTKRRYVNRIAEASRDLVRLVEEVKLEEGEDAIDEARASLLDTRDALTQVLSAEAPRAAVADRGQRRPSILDAWADNTADEFMRARRPSTTAALAPATQTHQPDEEAEAREARRRALHSPSVAAATALGRRTEQVMRTTNFECCAMLVMVGVGCGQLGPGRIIGHSAACTGIAVVGSCFACGAVWAFDVLQGEVSGLFSAGMEMMVMCWGGRAFQELSFWVMRFPEEGMSREWLRSYALPRAIENLVEVGTNAVFVVFLGGAIGSHALWIGVVAYCVGADAAFVVGYLLKKGRLPTPAKFVKLSLKAILMGPVIMTVLPVG